MTPAALADYATAVDSAAPPVGPAAGTAATPGAAGAGAPDTAAAAAATPGAAGAAIDDLATALRTNPWFSPRLAPLARATLTALSGPQ
jgi:hypothetical protein